MSGTSPAGPLPRSISSMLMPWSTRRSCDTVPIMPGRVLVAHDEHVARRRQVDDVVVDGDDAGRVLLAVERARDVRGRPLDDVPAQLDEVHVVARRRRRGLAHDEPALLGELRRVHERHRLVDAPGRARP